MKFLIFKHIKSTILATIRRLYAGFIFLHPKLIYKELENYNRAYHEQIQDLLTLFESYVSDTNVYITALARQAMMHVDRNDIWFNLQQIERGISGNVGKASRVASWVPYYTFSFFDDPTESEIEKSRSNEANLNTIRREINRSESVLQQKNGRPLGHLQY